MSDKPDLTTLLSMISSNTGNSKVVPEELLATLMNSSSKSSNNVDASNDSTAKNNTDDATNNLPDMEMMMRLMQIMKSSNQDSPSKELLKSLKPFLNDSRKEKVDQYIKILGMTKALEIFSELGDKPK